MDDLLRSLHDAFTCNPETGEPFWKVAPRSRRKAGDPAGSVKDTGYRQVKFNRHMMLVHRIVFAFAHGRWPVGMIDHINGDRSDNRISNLREATRGENSRNRSPASKGRSGIRGVHWDSHRNKWVASACIDGKQRIFGAYDDPELARLAFIEGAGRHWGEHDLARAKEAIR